MSAFSRTSKAKEPPMRPFCLIIFVAGCYVETVPPPASPPPAYAEPYSPPPATPSYADSYADPYYVEPPLEQPPAVTIAEAPPEAIEEDPGPLPYYGALWLPGYWNWNSRWYWVRGRWTAPPQPGYEWSPPHYQNYGGAIVYVRPHWRA